MSLRTLVACLGDLDLAGLTRHEMPPDRHLLGEPRGDLQVDGRAALPVRPLRGDLGCGAVLARIEVMSDVVISHDFIHGNNYDPTADEPITARFEFNPGQYEAALRSAGPT